MEADRGGLFRRGCGGGVERDVVGGVDAGWECCGWISGESEGDSVGGGAGAVDGAACGTGGELTVVVGGVDAAVAEGDVQGEVPR